MRLTELARHQDVIAEDLKDPAFRAEWERTQFAHDLAMKLIRYRIEHNLSQTKLARRLGLRQPQIARLQAGEQAPSLETLQRLAQQLGMSFHIDITPAMVALAV
ncbi:MAG: helix-turn-helix domain-containing protein [Dehalococcoidia bacterium]